MSKKKKGNKPPEKPLLSPETKKQIFDAILDGLNPAEAFIEHGVPKSTVYFWRSQSKKGIEPYKTLFDEIAVAEATTEHDMIKRLKAIPDKQGFLIKDLLSKRFSERWGSGKERKAPEGKDNYDGPDLRITMDIRNRTIKKLPSGKSVVELGDGSQEPYKPIDPKSLWEGCLTVSEPIDIEEEGTKTVECHDCKKTLPYDPKFIHFITDKGEYDVCPECLSAHKTDKDKANE